MKKTFRCLTCGFAQDFDPSNTALVVACHPWMEKVANKSECPACHKYINEGGRKNGKIRMPEIAVAGSLEDEDDPQVKAKREEMDADYKDLVLKGGNSRITAIRGKHKSKRIFGYTVDELLQLHQEAEAKKNK